MQFTDRYICAHIVQIFTLYIVCYKYQTFGIGEDIIYTYVNILHTYLSENHRRGDNWKDIKK